MNQYSSKIPAAWYDKIYHFGADMMVRVCNVTISSARSTPEIEVENIVNG